MSVEGDLTKQAESLTITALRENVRSEMSVFISHMFYFVDIYSRTPRIFE
jgi:hypothetical protein